MVARYEINMTMSGKYVINGHYNDYGLFNTEKEVEGFLNKKFELGELQKAEIWFN